MKECLKEDQEPETKDKFIDFTEKLLQQHNARITEVEQKCIEVSFCLVEKIYRLGSKSLIRTNLSCKLVTIGCIQKNCR